MLNFGNSEGDLNSYFTGHQPRDNKLWAEAINPNQVKRKATIIGTRVPERQIALVIQLDDTFFGFAGTTRTGTRVGREKSNASIWTDPDSQR